MNIWKSKHYPCDEVIICFIESWFSDEYYVVYWKWSKPSSWREKFFGCRWNKIYEYKDYRHLDYDSSLQWDPKTYHLDSSLIEVKNYVTRNIHTYKEMADYFGMTKSEKLYEETKRKQKEKEAENEELRKQL